MKMRAIPLLLALSLAIASSFAEATQQPKQGEQGVSDLLSDLGNDGRALKQFGFFNGGTNIIDLLFGNNNNGGGQSTQQSPPPPPPPPPSPPQQQQQQEQQSPPPPPPTSSAPPQVEIIADPVVSSVPTNENQSQIVELLAAEPSPPAPEQQQQSQPLQPSIVTDGASSLPLPSPPPPPPPSSSSSVQLTSPRFTPAPAVFTPTQLPTYPALGQASGPLSSSALSSVFPTAGGECKTLGQVLSAIPEVSQWLDLMKKAGGNVLLNDKNTQATLLVPINSAFSAGIDAQPLRPERTMQELINNAPDIVNPLVGYSVLRGLWPSATFIGGASVPTANTVDKVNPLYLQAKSQSQLQGIGNSANILQADIAACGPSVVHIIDQILLPFSFDQGPTDAITGTKVQQGQPGYAAAGKIFVDRRRGLLQFSPEEQAALDRLSTVFASTNSGSSSSSSSSSNSPPSPPSPSPPPPPPPPSSSSSSPPAPSTATTGARFTPAPTVFNRLNLPTYSKISQTSGPVSPDTLKAAAPDNGNNCKTIKEILSQIPQVSEWLALLESVGYDSILLTDKNAQATLFVPVNSAFSAGIDAQPLRKEKTLQELISNAPDVRTPLAGYSVVRGLWPSSTLTPGISIPSSNTIDKVNPLNIKVAGPTQLQGIGDDATILQSDIAACGPSVVHIIDQILLPFQFDQGPTDAITGTQVPTPPGVAAAG